MHKLRVHDSSFFRLIPPWHGEILVRPSGICRPEPIFAWAYMLYNREAKRRSNRRCLSKFDLHPVPNRSTRTVARLWVRVSLIFITLYTPIPSGNGSKVDSNLRGMFFFLPLHLINFIFVPWDFFFLEKWFRIYIN